MVSDLIGYRKTSLRRADDLDNLTIALLALISLVKEEKDRDPRPK